VEGKKGGGGKRRAEVGRGELGGGGYKEKVWAGQWQSFKIVGTGGWSVHFKGALANRTRKLPEGAYTSQWKAKNSGAGKEKQNCLKKSWPPRG